MANRATAAFVVSITGGSYQIISLYVASLIDNNASLYYSYGFETLLLTSFLVFWSASHVLEDWKGRITWPSITFGVGLANFSIIILAYYVQTSTARIVSYTPSSASIVALISGPIIIIIGGILGFAAAKQYSRDHGRAVLGQA